MRAAVARRPPTSSGLKKLDGLILIVLFSLKNTRVKVFPSITHPAVHAAGSHRAVGIAVPGLLHIVANMVLRCGTTGTYRARGFPRKPSRFITTSAGTTTERGAKAGRKWPIDESGHVDGKRPRREGGNDRTPQAGESPSPTIRLPKKRGGPGGPPRTLASGAGVGPKAHPLPGG
jgi:hypothetical protein